MAAQILATGANVWWLPEGRSPETWQRAEALGLRSADDMAQMVAECRMVLSVCPPAAAVEVAGQVAAAGFDGVYVDANAVSPGHAVEIAELMRVVGAVVVDGGIVGPPPRRPGTSRLYLSGDDSAVEQVRAVFGQTMLTPIVLPGLVGRASALKLAFASYNKITYVLAAQACALADGHGVLEELLELTGEALPGTPLARPEQVASAGPRAWRWEPEMREIAQACESVGLSGALAEAAAQTLRRWSGRKGDDAVTLAQLIADLAEDG